MDKIDGGDEIKKLGAGLTLLVLTVVIVGTVVISRPKSTLASVRTNTNTAATTSTSTSKQSSATTSASYKDGTYSATGHYDSPGGTESVKVSLTIMNDTVSSANVRSGANDPTALSYQTIFISGYKSHVVGKKINTIQLSNVSGSSLTSQGFNDALKQIENQAQV